MFNVALFLSCFEPAAVKCPSLYTCCILNDYKCVSCLILGSVSLCSCVGDDVAESEFPASRGRGESRCYLQFTKRWGAVVLQHGQQWTGTHQRCCVKNIQYNKISTALICFLYELSYKRLALSLVYTYFKNNNNL